MKKLISREIISEVNDMLNTNNSSFGQCKIEPGFAVRLGNVVVHKCGESSYIELDSNVEKETFAQWKKDVGKYLSRDLSHGNYSNLYELVANGKRVLLHKLSHKELPDAQLEGFNHVYIGDYHYTIIRLIPSDGRYTDSDENTEVLDDYSQYSCISEYDTKDKATDDEISQQGIALFTDADIMSESEMTTESDENEEELETEL